MGGLRDATPRLGVAQGTKSTLSLAFWYACEKTELWEGVQCFQWAKIVAHLRGCAGHNGLLRQSALTIGALVILVRGESCGGVGRAMTWHT